MTVVPAGPSAAELVTDEIVTAAVAARVEAFRSRDVSPMRVMRATLEAVALQLVAGWQRAEEAACSCKPWPTEDPCPVHPGAP